MRVAEAGDRDAGEEVEILVAVGIDQRAAAAAIDGQLRELRDALQTGCEIALLGSIVRRASAAGRRSNFIGWADATTRGSSIEVFTSFLVCVVRYEAIASRPPRHGGTVARPVVQVNQP